MFLHGNISKTCFIHLILRVCVVYLMIDLTSYHTRIKKSIYLILKVQLYDLSTSTFTKIEN